MSACRRRPTRSPRDHPSPADSWCRRTSAASSNAAPAGALPRTTYWRGSHSCRSRSRRRIRGCPRAWAQRPPARRRRRTPAMHRPNRRGAGAAPLLEMPGARWYRSSDLALLPLLELVEELVLLLRGERLSGAAGALVEEPREDLAHLLLVHRHGRAAVALDPGVRGSVAAPARQLRREIHLAPLGMVALVQELGELREERLDEARDVAVALGIWGQVRDHHDGADRHRIHCTIGHYHGRIVVGGEPRRDIGRGDLGLERDRQEMQAILLPHVEEERRGLARDVGECRDLARADLRQRRRLVVIDGRDL